MDKFRIDSHKLSYHPGRVSDWLQGKLIYPIYVENSPSGSCNHRCRFCAFDFAGYQPRLLDWDRIKDRFEEMGRLGVKSIMHSGEGEPLLHRRLGEMFQVGKASGIDQAMNTNGVLFTPERARGILPHAAWIRFSVDAGCRDTYAHLHGAKPDDFDKVLANIAAASALKKSEGWSCTLGVQCLLLPENRPEVRQLALLVRDAGADYLIVKPYSQHPKSITHRYDAVRYGEDQELEQSLRELNTPEFNVVFRAHAMEKWDSAERPYAACSALAFWAHIDAGGSVWACSTYLGDERFLYGNLYENTFQEIWEGERRRKLLEWVRGMDPAHCRVNCRMDEVNRYLWELLNPGPHVNFI
jgi:radical SAM protein with 4Fe4S-binding SPASM domain